MKSTILFTISIVLFLTSCGNSYMLMDYLNKPTVSSVTLDKADAGGYGITSGTIISETVIATVNYSDGSTDNNVSWTGGNGDGTVDFATFGIVTLTAISNIDDSQAASINLTVDDLSDTYWVNGGGGYLYFSNNSDWVDPYGISERGASDPFTYDVSGDSITLYWWNPGLDDMSDTDISDGVITLDVDNIGHGGGSDYALDLNFIP